MRLLLLSAILACACGAQTYTTTLVGSPIDCVTDGCNSILENGDTLIISAWDLTGSFTFNGVSGTGSVYGTYNDGANLTCDAHSPAGGNINWFRLSVLDLLTPSNITIANKNCMTSFQDGGSIKWPPATDGTCTAGVVLSCNWKTQGMISVDGKTYLQVFRQDPGASTYYGHDSTLVMTTDGGTTWTNPAHVGVSTDVNGDAPAGPGDATYPASIIWPEPSPYDGSTAYMARMQFVMYCRDNTVGCPSVDNNSTYVYALAYDGRFANYRVARGLRSTLAGMTAASWSYYHCPGYATTVCDGSNNANWDASVLNATAIMSAGTHGVLGGLIYSSDLGAYVFTGTSGTDVLVSTAPHVWGPYTTSNTFVGLTGYNFAAPIISSLKTITANSKVQLTIGATGYTHNVAGTLFLNTVEVTKVGGATAVDGSRISSPSRMGSKVRFSATGSGSSGGSLTVNVVSQSNTQAILSYTAPTTSACTVEASESPTYLPVVKDVDGAFFTGAASDARDGNLGAGTTSRMISVGRRTADLALDASYYSRALQANTTHYVRIDCSGTVGTTSFTTSNIPGGMTYQDIPPTISNTPFWKLPTVPADSYYTVVDQYTGALMTAVTRYRDRTGFQPQGMNMTSGAFVRACTAGQQTTTEVVPRTGFVCQFLNMNSSATSVFFIEPSTGLTTFLGSVNPNYGQVELNSSMCFTQRLDPSSSPVAATYCYNGDWLEHSSLPVNGGTTYSSTSVATQLFAFDATYDSSLFPCTSIPIANAGQYTDWECGRLGFGQDGYGWIAIYWGGNGQPYTGSCTPVTIGGACPGIVAAFNPMNNIRTRFCGFHHVFMTPNVADNPSIWMNILNWHGLNDPSHMATAAWTTTFSSGASSGAASIVVAGAPTNSFGGDTFNPGNFLVGDIVHLFGNQNVTVTSVSGTGPVTLGITPVLDIGHSSSETVSMQCNAQDTNTPNVGWKITYWKFLSDIHGTDTTNTTIIEDTKQDGGGHYDLGPNGMVSEDSGGWQVRSGNILTNIDGALNYVITDSPAFHGLLGGCFGDTCAKHPAYQQTFSATASGVNREWFTDQSIFDGSDFFGGSSNPATNVTGSLWKYTGNPSYAQYTSGKDNLYRKVLPTMAISGGRPYQDVSGPTQGNVIGTGAGDNWKYCVVYIGGECRSGSTAGDIFFNVAITLTNPWCHGGDSPHPLEDDICITAAPTHANAIPRLLTTASSAANATRREQILTHGIRGPRQNSNFPLAKVLPDASWTLFSGGSIGTTLDLNEGACRFNSTDFCNIWMAKNTPYPAQDAYDRSDFIAINTGSITGGGSVTNAIVQFGYLEFGTSSQFYCTSRAESCYANSATIPAGANPFSYPVDGSSNTLATLAGVTCTSTCNIDIPALSGHTLYYRVITRDSGNSAVTTGALQAVIVP